MIREVALTGLSSICTVLKAKEPPPPHSSVNQSAWLIIRGERVMKGKTALRVAQRTRFDWESVQDIKV